MNDFSVKEALCQQRCRAGRIQRHGLMMANAIDTVALQNLIFYFVTSLGKQS